MIKKVPRTDKLARRLRSLVLVVPTGLHLPVLKSRFCYSGSLGYFLQNDIAPAVPPGQRYALVKYFLLKTNIYIT